jgi:hypothetical protein
MARVLVPGGRCWLVLHSLRFAWRDLVIALRAVSARGVLYRSFVLANGLALHLTGHVIRYPLKRTRVESVQTKGGMRRVLRTAGFDTVTVVRDQPLVMEAVRSA